MIQCVGWVGVIVYIFAQASLIQKKAFDRHLELNTIGAILVAISSLSLGAWHSFLLNSFWATISITRRIRKFTVYANSTAISICSILFFSALLDILRFGNLSLYFGNCFGHLGNLFYILAYVSFTERMITKRIYLYLCISAGLMLVPVLIHKRDWPATSLQLIWVIISCTALLKTSVGGPKSENTR